MNANGINITTPKHIIPSSEAANNNHIMQVEPLSK